MFVLCVLELPQTPLGFAMARGPLRPPLAGLVPSGPSAPGSLGDAGGLGEPRGINGLLDIALALCCGGCDAQFGIVGYFSLYIFRSIDVLWGEGMDFGKYWCFLLFFWKYLCFFLEIFVLFWKYLCF